MKIILLFLLLLSFSSAYAADPYTEDAVKTNSFDRVQDSAGVLTSSGVTLLKNKIEEFEKASSNQLAVVIIPSLEGKEVQTVALQTAQNMGVGHKDKNNGILIFMAIKDRKISIQVGEGLEGAYPDIYAKQAIEVVKPLFKEGKYPEALVSIIEDVKLKTSAEFIKDNPTPKEDALWAYFLKHWKLITTIFFILLILDIVTIPMKHDIWMLTILWIILSSGSSSSSGRSSFGGGSFGGGGSSGDW